MSTSGKDVYFGFSGAIDSGSVTKICARLNHAHIDGASGITLAMTTGGGSVPDGIYAYNHIKALPRPTTTWNIGSVYSIGVTVFLAGKRRLCTENSVFMIHETTFNPMGQSLSGPQLNSRAEEIALDDARTDKIILREASIPEDVLAAAKRSPVYIRAEQALAWGIVHEIAEYVIPAGAVPMQIF